MSVTQNSLIVEFVKTLRDSKLLAKCAKEGNWAVKVAVARNNFTSKETFSELSHDEDTMVRYAVAQSLKTSEDDLDYLSNEEVLKGVRVKIDFGHQKIIGYVIDCQYSKLSKDELEKEAGFKYRYISEIIDDKPLLNHELQELSLTLSKLTLSPRISCFQAMLPPQLKPSSNKSTGIKYQKAIKFLSNQVKT